VTTHKFENTGSNHKIQTAVSHPPHTSDLAVSDCHFNGALKDASHGKRFGSDNKDTEEVAASTKFKLAKERDKCSFLRGTRPFKIYGEQVKKNWACNTSI
jgi:hypothetical protein